MTDEMAARKRELQVELIELRKRSRSSNIDAHELKLLSRRIKEVVRLLLAIDPYAALYENLGQDWYL